jgi:hypothetical protein
MSRLRRLLGALGADRIAALLFLLVFAAYGLAARGTRASLEADVVGPGFFPGIIAVLGAGLALIMLIRPAVKPDERAIEFDAVALTPAAILLVYVLSLPYLGFTVSTAVFLLGTFKYLGCPGWVRPIAYSAIATAVLIGLFQHLLGLMLPRGEVLRLMLG